MKKIKRTPETHTANTKYGSGDYYGSAIKQPVGRMRQDYMGFNSVTPNKIRKPPKSLA